MISLEKECESGKLGLLERHLMTTETIHTHTQHTEHTALSIHVATKKAAFAVADIVSTDNVRAISALVLLSLTIAHADTKWHSLSGFGGFHHIAKWMRGALCSKLVNRCRPIVIAVMKYSRSHRQFVFLSLPLSLSPTIFLLEQPVPFLPCSIFVHTHRFDGNSSYCDQMAIWLLFHTFLCVFAFFSQYCRVCFKL